MHWNFQKEKEVCVENLSNKFFTQMFLFILKIECLWKLFVWSEEPYVDSQLDQKVPLLNPNEELKITLMKYKIKKFLRIKENSRSMRQFDNGDFKYSRLPYLDRNLQNELFI